jgi:hypothetical protein
MTGTDGHAFLLLPDRDGESPDSPRIDPDSGRISRSASAEGKNSPFVPRRRGKQQGRLAQLLCRGGESPDSPRIDPD